MGTTAIAGGRLEEQIEACEGKIDQLAQLLRRGPQKQEKQAGKRILEIQQEITYLHDVLSVLRAGYKEIFLPSSEQGWVRGYVEHRPFTHPFPQSFAIALVVSAGVIATIMPYTRAAAVVFTPAGSFLMWIALSFALAVVIRMLVEEILVMINESVASKAIGYQITISQTEFFQSPMPSAARVAYAKAAKSKLFATVKICAPEEAFRKKIPDTNFIIYGETEDGRAFLVA